MKNNYFKKPSSLVTGLMALTLLLVSCQKKVPLENVEQWGVYELVLRGPSHGNPYMDYTIGATFTIDGHTIKVPGFYDGNGSYKIRFSPNKMGEWSYSTQSNVAELGGQKGAFLCVAPAENNHGPVRIVNTHYLEYADGSSYYPVGTTAYQWTSVKQTVQEKTLETLKKAPFNKIRMCVFPKTYKYGNDTEPWILPFKKRDSVNDLTRPNFEFFQNFDKRVKQLMDMGIQADVILFHPYDDRWGYDEMGREMNEKYVRHMIARLSAYRNVWWSLANEWDVPSIKETIDWEGIGTLLQREDPHQRLRGIHNWYHDESHFYDHTRPWITHISAQTYYFFNALKWRERYQKPLLYDEMRYEGDVESSWGNMDGKEMTSYFWMAALSGGYGTHGDTFKNDSDNETEVRWWAKGGTLMGESPERIAFFYEIMKDVPVTEMIPEIVSLSEIAVPDAIPDKVDSSLIAQLINNNYILSKENKYYMAYTMDAGQTIELNLGGTKNYHMEVIDTWNMHVVSKENVEPGNFKYETKMPYTALRLVSEE